MEPQAQLSRQTPVETAGRNRPWQQLYHARSLPYWLAGLLAALYFLPGGSLSNIGPLTIAIPALLALASAETRQSLKPLQAVIAFFLVAGLWTVAITVYRGGDISDVERAAGNFVTLTLLIVFTGLFAKSRTIEVVLWMLLAFAALSAAISLGLHFIEPERRLIAIGRAVNPIPAAGGFAAGILAAFVLWRKTGQSFYMRLPLLVGFAVLIFTLYQTGSRGPFIGLVFSLVFGTWLIALPRFRWMLAAIAFVFGGLVLAMTVEDWLRPFLCPLHPRLCDPSYRVLLWGWTFEQIAATPLLGTGPHHRFPDEGFNNPHNGLFGLAMYYGIPFALISLTLFTLALRRIIQDAAPLPRAWCIVSLIFTSAYVASDQSNIFAFFNTHYVFFWIPFLLAYASAVMPDRSDGHPPAAAEVKG